MKSLERVLTRCTVFDVQCLGFIYTSCAAHMSTILALPALVTLLTAYAKDTTDKLQV